MTCAKWRCPIRFAGLAGFSSLLFRALALAKAEVPALAAVHVRPDGALEGFDAPAGGGGVGAGSPRSIQPAVVLVAQLLSLLVTFIGEPITVRLVRDAWPDVFMDGLNGRSKTKP